MAYETLLYDVDGAIATITLNRPERLNAFNREMVDLWLAALQDAQVNDEVQVVVLTGRPTKVHEVIDVGVPMPRTAETRTTPEFIELRRHLEEVMRSMSSFTHGGTK